MAVGKVGYKELYPKGSRVRIASRDFLERFMRSWKYHHPLQPEQLVFADQEATVASVGMYHGGDQVYVLQDIPGSWNEECLGPVN